MTKPRLRPISPASSMAEIPRGCASLALARKKVRALVVVLAVLIVSAGCSAVAGSDSVSTSAVVLDGTSSGFAAFSGMDLPDSATDVDIRVSTGETGQPDYLVAFDVPTDQVDSFCRHGQMSRPLRVLTIPESTRKTFGYDGGSSSGVRIGEASLPSNVRIQREVFATGTHGAISHVQVHAYAIGR